VLKLNFLLSDEAMSATLAILQRGVVIGLHTYLDPGFLRKCPMRLKTQVKKWSRADRSH
jgi:hypothetical protein